MKQPKLAPTTSENTYYLCKDGTGARVTTRDGEPVVIEHDVLAEKLAEYEQHGNATLVPLTIREWVQRYKVPYWAACRDERAKLDEGASRREES